MKKIELCIVMAALVVLALVVCGCEESLRTGNVWGQGDPPADWQGSFGNSNLARINFVQTQIMNKRGKAIVELTERVRALEARTVGWRSPESIAKKMLGKDAIIGIDPNEAE